jgi:hypothetical protein
MGCIKRIINEVTAKCKASVAHIITANTKSAIAAWPARSNPGVGISMTIMNAIIARGMPDFCKLMCIGAPF